MKNCTISEGTVGGEPVTVAEVKANSRVDITDDDTLFTTLISAARDFFEKRTRRTTTERTVTMKMDEFPLGGEIILRRPPIQSVTSITYVDADGVSQTWSSSEYQVTLGGDMDHARIEPAYGYAWPTPRVQPAAVTVTYVAGYEADESGSPTDYAANVPESIKACLKVLVAHWYDNRSHFVEGQSSTVPMMLEALIDAHSLPEV